MENYIYYGFHYILVIQMMNKYEDIAEGIVKRIPEEDWEDLTTEQTSYHEVMIETIKLLQEHMSFATMGEVAKMMVEILDDYVEGGLIKDQLDNGIDLLVTSCEIEEKRIHDEHNGA